MPTPPLTDEQLHEAVNAWRETILPELPRGNVLQAANAIGLSKNAMNNRLRHAAQRGLIPLDKHTPGFIVKRFSETTDKNGEVVRQSVVMAPEAGGKFNLPQGHLIKGVSALMDGQGNVQAQWVKTSAERSPEATAETIKAAFEGWEPKAPNVIRPENSEDLVNVFIACDWHIGMHAWGKETGGSDYNLKIAREVITETFAELVDGAPRAATGVFLGLGDLQHADNVKGLTEGSGNVLDMDSRYPKMTEATCDIVLDCIHMLRTTHDCSDIILRAGNHDESFTAGLRWAMRALFRDDPNTYVDTSPAYLSARRYGVNLLGSAHGDKAKMAKLPFLVTTQYKQEWAMVSTCDIHTGHIHHDTLKDENGIRVYSHRAPIPADGYHAANGYLGGRSMKCYQYSRTRGSRGYSEVIIP